MALPVLQLHSLEYRSPVFEELPFDERTIEPTVHTVTRDDSVQAQLPFSIVPPDGPAGETPHTLMDHKVFADDDVEGDPSEAMGELEYRGREFGSQVHDFAERYALGEDVSPASEDEEHVKRLLDGLDGQLHVEEQAVLPLDVDGEQVTISGIVDLVQKTAEELAIIDYKTDRTRRAEPEYRKQLSVYHHVLSECYPAKTVTASIFYTATGEHRVVEPHSRDELVKLVRTAQ